MKPNLTRNSVPSTFKNAFDGKLKVNDWMQKALDWALPNKCLICNCNINNSKCPTCKDCYALLPHRFNNCPRCGQTYTTNLDYCGKCISTPPIYDACFCAFEYKEPIAKLIRKFKYHDHPELAQRLAKLLYQEIINQDIELPDLLIPVPLHISKLRQRGFNQSLLLTKELSKLLYIPYKSDIIYKSKATTAQADLSLALRRKNLKNCFKQVKETDAKHIVIIDDVVTTSATATEITKVLKKTGVEYIQIWGLAQRA